MFYNICAEIIEVSSDSSEATLDVQPISWEDYFPNDYNPKDYFVTSKRVENNTNLTPKQEAKMAFQVRGKVLGLPNQKHCAELGIKPFEIKNPNAPKGKGKKNGVKAVSSTTHYGCKQYVCFWFNCITKITLE